MSDLREQLAELVHEQRCVQILYLLSKCTTNDDGEMVIPASAVERWERQTLTAYADLSEAEKELDRAEADRVLKVVQGQGDVGVETI